MYRKTLPIDIHLEFVKVSTKRETLQKTKNNIYIYIIYNITQLLSLYLMNYKRKHTQIPNLDKSSNSEIEQHKSS